MRRIIWTRTAAAQFALVREQKLRLEIYFAIQGLARFPQKGRVTPEISQAPDLKFPGDLREIVIPNLLRIFYLDRRIDRTIQVMGMSFHGQQIDREWLAKLLSD